MAHAHHVAVKIGFGSPNIKAKCVRIVGNAERKTFKTYKALQEMGLLPTKETNVVQLREKNVGQDDFDDKHRTIFVQRHRLIGAKPKAIT